MKNKKRDGKIEDLKVLDSGMNFNDITPLFSFCCMGLFIPYRW